MLIRCGIFDCQLGDDVDDEARVRPVGGVGSHTSVTGQVLRPAIALERRKHTSRLMNTVSISLVVGKPWRA